MKKVIIISLILGTIFILSKDKLINFNQSNVRAQSQSQPTDAEWWTVAGNPERTSRVSSEVSGSNLALEWYKPIEAYIPQNSQLIATNDMIYVSSARGLYAIRYDTGDVAWTFDTELPMGNSPTVINGVAYVGGMDKKLYALDANTGSLLWSFDNATAGYSANPLVVNGVIYAANRDGYLYAIEAHGATRQGQELWKFKSGGPIVQSPAYKNNTIYFAANDNYGYAVDTSGQQRWKSQKLPGDGYQSYWPVIYTNTVDNKDYVIFTGAPAYRQNLDPGTLSLTYPAYYDSTTYGFDCNPTLSSTCTLTNFPYSSLEQMQRDDVFPWTPSQTSYRRPGGTLPAVSITDSWAAGRTVYDGSQISEYLENKPWRKVMVVLDAGNGQEFTQDVDSDGRAEPAPVAFWGTRSGQMYPPVVGSDDTLYVQNIYTVAPGNWSIAGGRIWGWRMGTPYFLQAPGGSGQGAMDEAQSLSIGGNLMYRSICCDRVGNYFDLRPSTVTGRIASRQLWGYDNGTAVPEAIVEQAPDYAQMWFGFDPLAGMPGLHGNYGGDPNLGAPQNGRNGIYHNHGVQTPMIPYKGKVFIFRGNSVLAYGTGTPQGSKGLLRISAKNDSLVTPSTDDLKARLEAEINKMDVDGDGNLDNLRPGYYNIGQVNFGSREHTSYFSNPGDTLYTLTKAYPYLSTATQEKVRTLLQTEFTTYFSGVCNSLNNPTDRMCARRGWAEGQPREAMPMPDDILTSISNGRPSTWVGHLWGWTYPQHNFYAMWKYAELFPTEALNVYNLARTKLQVPAVIGTINRRADNTPIENVWETNGYISGYIGFLKLQELAGRTTTDATLRQSVQQELNRLLTKRAGEFTKDSPWINPADPDAPHPTSGDYHYRGFNIARNFMMLVPEAADQLLAQNVNPTLLSKVQDAWSDYNYVAPYWFVSRYDAIQNEGVNGPLDTYHALFQAKAYILKEPYEELVKYLDVPAFAVGDLFYIQNLTAALEVSQAGSTDINGDTKVDLFDLQLLFENWNTPRDRRADINSDNVVNGVDFGLVLRDWGKVNP